MNNADSYRCKVKICGLTNEQDARLICSTNVDYAGIVMFYEKSKRNVSIIQAKKLITQIRNMQICNTQICNTQFRNAQMSECQSIKIVAVTVSPTIEQVREIEAVGFDAIQIHGELTDEVYNQTTIPIIRAIQITEQQSVSEIETKVNEFANKSKIAAILVDGKNSGSGNSFDWTILSNISRNNKMFILAGGLNSKNVGEAIDIVHPDVVDVSSGVEYDYSSNNIQKDDDELVKKGKDPDKVNAFLSAVMNKLNKKY